jgi:hypothetical protein
MLGGRLPLFVYLLITLMAVLILSAGQATGASRNQTSCTWGASSVRAQLVGGKLEVSQPATSGCIPK